MSSDTHGPFIRLWDGYDHARFIAWAYKTYSRAKSTESLYRLRTAGVYYKNYREVWRSEFLHTALRLFKVGKRNYVLDLSFEDFWNRLDPIQYGDYRQAYHARINQKKEYSDYYPRNGAHFRQRVPLRITEKKELSESTTQYREWRALKGFARDKARNGWAHRGRPTRYGKQVCNRTYRRHVKTTIQKGQYSKLTVVKPKDYFDPWMWD